MAKKTVVKPVAPVVPAGEMEFQLLDPNLILADKNARYGLKQSRVESMKDSIIQQGGVMEPIEVSTLAIPVEGKLFRVVDGHYRLAGLLAANAAGAGLQMPAVIVDPGDELNRLKRQHAHNNERENETPIDKAHVIREALALGMSKADVRAMFASAGGRKGAKVQDASNSFINMHLSFLDFPDAIQKDIHEGLITVGGAYELRRRSPDKWPAMLDSFAAARKAEADKAEADEKKLLEEESKHQADEAKRLKTEEELTKAQEITASAEGVVQTKLEQVRDAYNATLTGSKEERSKAKEKHSALEAELKKDQAAAADLAKELKKKSDAAEALKKLSADRAEKLRQQREALSTAKPKAAGSGAMKKAGAAAGDGGLVKLNATAMRTLVHDNSLPGTFPILRGIMVALGLCFDGQMEERQFVSVAGILTGEKKTADAATKKIVGEIQAKIK